MTEIDNLIKKLRTNLNPVISTLTNIATQLNKERNIKGMDLLEQVSKIETTIKEIERTK